MMPGYMILGVLWMACTIGFVASGAADTIGAAIGAGLLASLILILPVAFVVAGVAGTAKAVMAAVRCGRPHRRRVP